LSWLKFDKVTTTRKNKLKVALKKLNQVFQDTTREQTSGKNKNERRSREEEL